MASELENKLNTILGNNAEEITEAPVETTKHEVEENKDEGVETAESEVEEPNKDETEEQDSSDSNLEEELRNIDPELRDAILSASPELRESQIKVFKKMRASIDRKHTELGEAKKIAETTKEFFKQYGIDEKKGFDQIKNLIEFEKQLKSSPQETINSLKSLFKLEDKQSGSEEEIDLDSLTDNERIIYNKLIKAEEEAKIAKREVENFKKLSEREQNDLILKEINHFRSATNEDGSLKNPYFDELLPEMERLSEAYPNYNVDKLYQTAIKLNDDIAVKIEEDKRKREGFFLTKKQEEALLKAKSINSQSLKHKSSSSNNHKSLDDILLNILDSQS